MLWKVLSRALERFLYSDEVEARLVNSVNWERFYVENVRSALGSSYAMAREIVETGVARGLYERGTEYTDPVSQRVLHETFGDTAPPAEVEVLTEVGDSLELITYPVDDLQASEVFRSVSPSKAAEELTVSLDPDA